MLQPPTTTQIDAWLSPCGRPEKRAPRRRCRAWGHICTRTGAGPSWDRRLMPPEDLSPDLTSVQWR